MTTKEFEYLKENWDNCIDINISHTLIPFDLLLMKIFKPDGDYFVCLSREEFNKHVKMINYSIRESLKEFIKKLEEDTSFVTTIRIHHKKVQRIDGYNKGYRYRAWENNDWKVEVRNDKLRQLGI